MNKRDSMILKFNEKHKGKFDYSNVNYINNRVNIKIICPLHGEFYQSPKRHLISDTGCNKCTNVVKRKMYSFTSEEFIEKSKKIWGNKYDYSKVEYINSHTKVIIIYNNVEYYQIPYSHLGKKSPEDRDIKRSTEEFITESNIIHKNKYDYSITEYTGSGDYIEFIYNDVIFRQVAIQHLNGQQPDMESSLIKISPSEFIEKCNHKFAHRFKYESLENELRNINSKITIFCDLHGFTNQKAYDHLNSKSGCKHCVNNKSKGEFAIESYLNGNNIKNLFQYWFNECRNILPLPFDFYLPDFNICIEFDGIQHFESVEFFGGNDKFNIRKQNDVIKNKFCTENNIKLIRIPYYDINNIEYILKNELHND